MAKGGGASALTTMFSSANAQTPGGLSSQSAIVLTTDEATKVGYWPITKAVVDAMRADVPSGGNLLFSGHSQGGGRAQLAGMYIKKKHSEDHRVVTFAAVGASCFPRLLYSGANLLADVDPTLQYPLFTDYANPLDPWGSHLGPDVGRTCFYGTTSVLTTRAYKYCSKVFGYSGPNLIYADTEATDAVKSTKFKEVQRNFKQCRYYTHLAESVLFFLSKTGALKADGTTDGGCVANAPIPTADPQGKCPTGEIPNDEKWAGIGVAIFIVIICCVLLVIAIHIVVCFVCCVRKVGASVLETVGVDMKGSSNAGCDTGDPDNSECSSGTDDKNLLHRGCC